MITIRPATEADVHAITEIYNDAVLTTTATFDLEERSEEERLQWFRNHDEQHPVIVSTINDKVVGWAALTRWSEKKAYDCTAEVSLYVHCDYRKQGIGKKLLEVLTLEGEKAGLHSLIARITQGNEMSFYLHERLGFEATGVLKEIGHKFGKYLDVHILQKVFKQEPTA